ncbi:MAG: LysR family transcriptional regulator [Burkholderiales bacterium]|nr:LysR family transcriptional regulator [Burkholderiales bacterium]OJX02466.1 MAG: hypothetical protein BGO72_01845 [Burkholderiales bacterium 70-64]
MNLSVRQLRAFVEVARLASFTRAAERVHVTQAGLSAMIRELEAQLGARLFERTTRSVTPTSAGRALLPSAERVLAELERARERIARIDSAASARVAVTALIAAHVLPPVIARLHAAHPGVALDIVDAGPQEMQRMVERDEVDLALGAFLRPAAGIERVAVFRFGLALATLPSHPGLAQRAGGSPGRGGGTLPWQRLRGEPLIGLAADNLLQQRIDVVLARHGVEPSIAARFNTLETVLAMAAAGIGSAIVPTFTRPACRRYGLRMIGLRAPEAGFDFYRISRKGAAFGPAVALLIGLLREEVDAIAAGAREP